MKFENLVFQNKSRKGGSRGARNYAYPNVSCSGVKAGHGSSKRVVFTFRACDTLYSSNNYCCYAIAGNRIYFMFCGESDSAYKLMKVRSSAKEKRQLGIQYNKETSKFISSKEYTPKLDNECGLWYIEY